MTVKTSIQPNSEPYIIGDDTPVPSWIKSYYKLLIVASLILLIGGAVLFMRYEQRRTARNDLVSYQTASLQSQRQRGTQQYNAAIVTLQDYVDHGKDTTRRSYALVMIASTYDVQKKYSQALAAYRKAEMLRGQADYVITVGIARDAEQLGDKKTALAYYKKTVHLMDGLPAARRQAIEDDRNMYQLQAEELQKTL